MWSCSPFSPASHFHPDDHKHFSFSHHLPPKRAGTWTAKFQPGLQGGVDVIRMIFSEPKFLECMDNPNFLPMVLRATLRVVFQCRVIFTCVCAYVRKIYVRKENRGNVWKVTRKRESWTSLNFLFKLSNFYLASILFTWLKFTCVNVRSQKRVSGNTPQEGDYMANFSPSCNFS